MESVLILGIESSFDDTGVSVVRAFSDGRFEILSNELALQDHVKTGGAVPELAARRHGENIVPTIQRALSESAVTPADIDVIAVTTTPGMIACLQVGIETARTLAVSWSKPLIGVHHMKAHIASTFAEHPHVAFPAVVLLASGAHTMLVRMDSAEQYALLGQTRDDAAGEAFDKIARMLGLPYPGGPEIARLAEGGDPAAFAFPRPMAHETGFEFSFAGLKTSILYAIRDLGGLEALSQQQISDIAASAQQAIIDVLVKKTMRAVKQENAKTVILGGGVSANVALRTQLEAAVLTVGYDCVLIVPSPGLFTDNGAMIAIAAAPRALRKEYDDPFSLTPVPRTSIND